MTKSEILHRLGLTEDSKVVILASEELGFSNSINVGTYDALRRGLLTSTRIMVPAPWARGAISSYHGEDVGVQLVTNSDHPIFHFAPLTYAPSLFDGSGGFPAEVEDFWDHADPEETRREARAQIERAIYWGFDVSHLASAKDAMVAKPEFFDILLELALEFRLPLRLDKSQDDPRLGFPAFSLASDEGVLTTDQHVDLWHKEWLKFQNPTEVFEEVALSIKPGITEVTLRLGEDSAELRALMQDWPRYVSFQQMASNSKAIMDLFGKMGIKVIGYRDLKQASQASS
ncbi:MAG: ChbG/HpnK family deacetylase [Acidimicrobiaceae bacterium]|nr:ChbG/HpnK family deacetylase [Acidimicrobiaceae bacterium]